LIALIGFVDPSGHGALGIGLAAIAVVYAVSQAYDSLATATNRSNTLAQMRLDEANRLNSSDPASAEDIGIGDATRNLLKDTGKFGIDASKAQWTVGKQQAKACSK
jgi:hypothetical protein